MMRGVFGSFIAAEKPELTDEKIVNRLSWALRYKDWIIEDWNKMI